MERSSGAEEYISRVEELLALGEGYSEVSHGGQLYPRVSLAFRGAYGVVAYWPSGDEMLLLLGDGIIPSNSAVSVPELEGDAKYTGEFVSGRQRAWDAVKNFIASSSVDEMGQWVML